MLEITNPDPMPREVCEYVCVGPVWAEDERTL